MNDHLTINAHGIELLTDFEKGDPDLAPLTPGGAATVPYVCPGGELTIGYGCTKWFGGRDVLPTDRIRDEAHALELLREQVVEYEDAVRKSVTVELNSNQFSALTCLAYNIGIHGFAYSGADGLGSSPLKRTNERRFDAAAEAFSLWTIITNGQHRQRSRGLLRRRYAEACLYMGYHWGEAVEDDFIRMKVQRPPNLIGEDKVLFKTPFNEVLVIAQRYPLPSLDDVLDLTIPANPVAVPAAGKAGQPGPTPNPAPAAPAAHVNEPAKIAHDPPVVSKIPPIVNTKTATASPVAGAAVTPEVPRASPPSVPAAKPTASPATPPATVPAKITPPPLPKDAAPASLEPKDMILSKRFWGLTVTAIGTTNFLPRGWSEWVNNEGNRELLTWLVVVVIGFALYKYGQHKAKKPLK